MMRGAAILLVLLSHVTAKMLPTSLARLFTPCGGIGVAVFLILSGYGLTVRYREDVKGYWYNRFTGTFLPYLLVWGLTLWLHRYHSVSEFVLDVLALDPQISYFWYLGYLAIWYVAFYLAHRFLRGTLARYLLYFAVSILVLLFGPELWAEQAFSFLLGCVLAEELPLSRRVNAALMRHPILIALICAVLGVGALALKQLPAVRDAHALVFIAVQMLIKLPLALCVILAVGRLPWATVNRALGYVGGISYELYLIHSVTILVFDLPKLQALLALPLFLVLTALLSYALSLVGRKLRAMLKKQRKVGMA